MSPERREGLEQAAAREAQRHDAPRAIPRRPGSTLRNNKDVRCSGLRTTENDQIRPEYQRVSNAVVGLNSDLTRDRTHATRAPTIFNAFVGLLCTP